MEEKFSVELEAKIGKFKNTMKTASDIANDWYNHFKQIHKISISPDLSVKELQYTLITLKKEMADLKGMQIMNAKDVEKVAILENKIEAFTSRIKELGATPWKWQGLEEAKEDSEEVAKNMDVINVKATASSGGLSRTFTKATKSLKRFALSLFGLRSIWAVISRGIRSYMADNKELSNTMKGVWNAIGTLLAPVAELLANIFLKLLGYINEVTKALFGYDFIAKANAKTMEAYAKSTSKASKALAGFDEITNLQSQNEDEGPQGLIQMPELNQGIVEGLKNVSYWLKDNWDWLQYVVYGLGLAFGAKAVAGWLKGIGSLLGMGTAGVVGGAGLLGLAGTLGFIATLGTIAVTIKLTYDAYKQDQEQIKAIETGNELNDTLKNGILAKGKTVKQYKKGSKEVNQYVNILKEEIASNATLIGQNYDILTGYGHIENWLSNLSGKTATLEGQIENSENAIDNYIDALGELYEQGLLTEEQEEYYQQLLTKRDEKIKLVGKTYQVETKNYIGLTQDNINTTQKLNDKISSIADNVKNTFGIAFGRAKKEISDLPVETQNMVNRIKEQFNKPFDILFKIKTSYEGGGTGAFGAGSGGGGFRDGSSSSIKGIVNSMIDELNKIFEKTGFSFMKIPRLSIGTDIVKEQGLAYLHKGEKVVPADVASGGFSGNNDETNDLLRTLIRTLEDKDFSATISSSDIGRASVNYINNQNRIMGGSVI